MDRPVKLDECDHLYQKGACTYCGVPFMEETDLPIYNFTGGTAVSSPSLNTRQEHVIQKLKKLGVIPTEGSEHLQHNVGTSNYAEHIIQPWHIWQDWNLNPFDADAIKRLLRTKQGSSRIEDYEKVIHICQERIRQIKQA